MSIFSEIAKVGRSIIKTALPFVPGPIGTIAKVATAAGIGGAVAKVATPTIRAAAPGALVPLAKAGALATRALPGVGKVGGAIAKKAGKLGTIGKVAAGTIAGDIIYDQFGNPVGVRRKRRRMNYCNMKAANRATRRIKGARKQLQKIEKALPTRTVHRRERAPCR